MQLTVAKVGPFKSINGIQEVKIDPAITVLVGMNEAGKTVFLQALEKSRDALGEAKFDPVDDYPRKELNTYLKVHESEPARATELTYKLTDNEVAQVNQKFGTWLPAGFQFSVSHHYDNSVRVAMPIDERPAITSALRNANLSSDVQTEAKTAAFFRDLPELLKKVNLTEPDKAFLAGLETRLKKHTWTKSLTTCEIWEWLEPKIPKSLYFSDYDLLPSKMNLTDLAQRVATAAAGGNRLQPRHRGVLALLRMAGISIDDFAKPGGYEKLKAKVEGVSINLTDRIMAFWKQNEDLEVQVDIQPDLDDEAPFNTGPNLYLRIKNRRHRGVSTPFQQRSRGFIWFFSFLVWFDSVQHQLDAKGKLEPRNIILLLDEPGLALHAMAQSDFLAYIDELAKKHQVLYTTHSPFMIHSNRLHQVRVVEDHIKDGTKISESLSGTDPRTIFPLQAALGWTIAQNLFISERNLLVEGPSELIYLKAVSGMLEKQGKEGLRNDVTIVPVGGLDNLATFIALLGASGLKLAVLHDYHGGPEQRLTDLARQKLISPKALLNAAQFRDPANIGTASKHSDTEDLFAVPLYLDYFNDTFGKSLPAKITEPDLPPGDRIIDRLERYLTSKNISVRPSGGFNHYLVASEFASKPPTTLDNDTLNRFEALLKAVNALF
jgi:hypothetical protein